MPTKYLLLSVACFAAALVMLVFAEGNQQIYATLFFTLIGMLMIVEGRRAGRARDEQ